MNNALFKEIQLAEKRIRDSVLITPLMESMYLSELVGANVFLKLESEQHTGSFKIRGATNKVLSLTEEQKKKGVITASTGNHGQALARALRGTGVKGTVYVPENADLSKVDAIKRYGAQVEFYGKNSVETELYAKKKAKEEGRVWVSPYNDPQIIAGQGSVGVEIYRQLPKVDAVLICVGGGGLTSGVGTYLKSMNSKIKIVGCLPENSAEMYESIKQGKFIASDNKDTISDGSAGGFEEGSITYEICKEVVDDFILVSEDEIEKAIKLMVDVHHKIIEGAAGVAVASLLKQKKKFVGRNVVVVICGANIATSKLKEIM